MRTRKWSIVDRRALSWTNMYQMMEETGHELLYFHVKYRFGHLTSTLEILLGIEPKQSRILCFYRRGDASFSAWNRNEKIS